MKRLSTMELRRSLGEILDRAEQRGERVVIHRRGKAAAAIIPLEDLKLLEKLIRDEEDRVDGAASMAARAESEELSPLDEVRRRLELIHESGGSALPPPGGQGGRTRPGKAAPKAL